MSRGQYQRKKKAPEPVTVFPAGFTADEMGHGHEAIQDLPNFEKVFFVRDAVREAWLGLLRMNANVSPLTLTSLIDNASAIYDLSEQKGYPQESLAPLAEPVAND